MCYELDSLGLYSLILLVAKMRQIKSIVKCAVIVLLILKSRQLAEIKAEINNPQYLGLHLENSRFRVDLHLFSCLFIQKLHYCCTILSSTSASGSL